MAEDFSEKTEQPTDKRLEESRNKGQVAQSSELSTCLMILFSSIFFYFTVSHGFHEMFRVYSTYVRNVNLDINVSNVIVILSFGAYRWAMIVMPFCMLILVISIGTSLAQTRFLWSFESMTFKIEKLNPFAGIKKLFSKRSAVEVIKSVIKIILLVYIVYTLIIKEFPEILSLPQKDTQLIVGYLGGTAFSLALKIGFFFLFIAGLDFLYQKWQHKKDLMMTFQEVKEESKERDGNPQIKSRIRSLQREISRRRMIEEVKTADVIVTNPTTFAIALKYRSGEMPAPKIVAKGAGFIAEKIKETAKRYKVPVIENKPLARAMYYAVRVGSFVPENFYMVVAELLAQVYKQRKRTSL